MYYYVLLFTVHKGEMTCLITTFIEKCFSTMVFKTNRKISKNLQRNFF